MDLSGFRILFECCIFFLCREKKKVVVSFSKLVVVIIALVKSYFCSMNTLMPNLTILTTNTTTPSH